LQGAVGLVVNPTDNANANKEQQNMKLVNVLKNFWNDETGLELSEYAVGAGLIAIAVATAFTNLGSKITSGIDGLTNKIQTT
jgi:Flp pilus assembly pilin Flp